jgi:hypothetical protein
MRCPYCGGDVSGNARACGHCGRILVVDSSAPLPAQGAPPRSDIPPWMWGLVGVLVFAAIALIIILIALLFVLSGRP